MNNGPPQETVMANAHPKVTPLLAAEVFNSLIQNLPYGIESSIFPSNCRQYSVEALSEFLHQFPSGLNVLGECPLCNSV